MNAEANPTPAATESNDSLQFDRAEFNQSAAFPCSFCKTPVSGDYFQVNGQTACPNCRQQIDSAMSGGSKALRALRAMAGGIVAGIGGFFIYWAVRAMTGYEVGLISILVGFMVGGAVRWGAQIRGGLFYQLIAVVLTYMSIASNYTPDVLQGMREGPAEEAAAAAVPDSAPIAADNTSPAATSPDPTATTPSHQTREQIPLWFAIPVAFIISLAVPFMGGVSNLIGWLIIAFGLIQAWSMNKRVPIAVSGPFHTGSAPPPAPMLQT